MNEPTHVIDPHPSPPTNPAGCEFKLYPTPDKLIFCDRPAVAVLTAPCCGQETRACGACLDTMKGLGSWLCLGCGVTTDCQWTPIEFAIRWVS